MSLAGTAGGAAASGGFTFQHRVAAWVAVRILAEQEASPPWDLRATSTLTFLRCETGEPVDDLLVGTSDDRVVLAQCKRTLDLSEAPTSGLAGTLDQFVRQILDSSAARDSPRPWQRPFDDQDRLLMVVGPDTSVAVRVYLAAALDRLRTLLPGQSIMDAAVNGEQQRALRVAIAHVRRLWQEHAGTPSDEEVRFLLSLVRVFPLDIEPGRPAELQALDLLRQRVLQDPYQTNAAWLALLTACAEFTRNRSGADRAGLMEVLLRVPCELVAARSFRDDINRLRKYTQTTLRDLSDAARIHVGAIDVKIERASTQALRHTAEVESVIVVGDAGAGKSAALHDLVSGLSAAGRDVVLFTAGRIEATSLGTLRTELGLDHDFLDVVRNWPGLVPGVVVVDALDAARAEPAAAMLLELIARILEDGGRWRVVASVRKFDLRYSSPLQSLFSGRAPTSFTDPEFQRLCHVNIPLLSDQELDEVQTQSSALYSLVQGATDDLRGLLRVAFNLRLMAELLAEGVGRDELTPIRSQHELLEKYWSYRVIRFDGLDGARESVLRRACTQMVARRRLLVDRGVIEDPSAAPHVTVLLSCQLLREWQATPTATPERYVLTFAHHILFDYAVARTILRGTIEDLVVRLASDPDLVLFLRPSLRHHLQHLWQSDPARTPFWDAVFALGAASGIPEVAKIMGPAIAVSLATEAADFESLVRCLSDPRTERRVAAEQAFRQVAEALLEDPEASGLTAHTALWCQLLDQITR
jgi:hypothetical protein